MTQTPTDMVFSQKSVNTHSVLKVVELNRLKPKKVNGENGVIAGGNNQPKPMEPVATTSYSEVYLKPEPKFESIMFNESDCESFQDLVPWCSDPAKEELLQTSHSAPIDSLKTREQINNTDTLHTPFSPQGWNDLNAPGMGGLYASTPNDPLSPNMDGFAILDSKFLYNNDLDYVNKLPPQQGQDWDIINLPVVLGDLASEKTVDLNPYSVAESVDFVNNTQTTHNTEYSSITNTHKMLLMDDEDSLDLKLNPVIPREVENNNVVISDYLIDKPEIGGVLESNMPGRRGGELFLNVNSAVPWSSGAISTPEVLSYVEQLEKEKCIQPVAKLTHQWPENEDAFALADDYLKTTTSSPIDYNPATPKSESHLQSDSEDGKQSNCSRRKRQKSEDSDELYTPYTEYTPRKYKRRKPSLPIKDMIQALEGSQQLQKARRGRPPKRRESTVSSVCSVDDNTSTTSNHEMKYRELRDKNNEASKRSRMNRKLKELQMEQLAIELEERNKRLKVKADILEDMTKRLKEALMTAILQK